MDNVGCSQFCHGQRKNACVIRVEHEALRGFANEVIAPEALRQVILLNLQQAQEHYLTRNKNENWS
ncbi:MAG: hypothetical protein IT525_02630 [Nitrosomonas sp.]|nr:hypothetical protein [Nitrosomonas sp.]